MKKKVRWVWFQGLRLWSVVVGSAGCGGGWFGSLPHLLPAV